MMSVSDQGARGIDGDPAAGAGRPAPVSARWPLEFRVSPVLSFMEIPIIGHHRYSSIEVQRIENAQGVGLLAIIHRHAGPVDVYFEAHLQLDAAWRMADPAMAHLKAGHLGPVSFSQSTFEIETDGVNCDVVFRDTHDEVIRLLAKQAPKQSNRLEMFVPMPAEGPHAVLRLLLLDRFCMLRRKGTTVRVEVDGKACRPLPFALPVGFSRRYSGRFSGPVFLVGLNRNGRYAPAALEQANVDAQGGLRSTRVSRHGQWFELSFEPALPPVEHLPAHQAINGHASIACALGSVTTLAWSMARSESGAVSLEFDHVKQHWLPSLLSNPTLFLLGVLRWLKRRRVRLRWTGQWAKAPADPVLTSTWHVNDDR